MKYFYRIAILFTVLMAVACKKDKDAPVEPVDPVEPAVSLNLSFVLPEGAGKTVWEAGDKIIVHGEYAKDQVTVTLSAADISSDGKTAALKVDGLRPYKRTDCTSNLYAAYPAEAVDNLTHCFFYSKFSGTNQELLAACNDGTTFNFKPVCGTLTFSVDEALGVDSYEFFANKKEAVGYEFLQVKITDNETNLSQYKGEPVLTLTGNLEDVTKICIPNGTTLKGGFTMKFRKDGKPVKIFKVSEKADFVSGETIELGDISEDINDYDDPFSDDIIDIDANGNANCYIVTEPGTYKFKAVKGNSSVSYLEDVDHASIIWETWNNQEDVTANSIVASVSYAEDYMIFHTPETLRPGNALIAAVAESGDVLWSWHIWVPRTAITTSSYGDIMGAPLMSRDLGALVDAASDTETAQSSEAFGLSYQWGNKNPYPAPAALKSSSPATVAGLKSTVAPGQITLAQATADPTLLGHINNGDWLNAADNTLWSDDEKTIYDPCPAGYRVPKRDSSKPFWSSNLFTAAGWNGNTTVGWFTIGNPVATFPLAGYRDDYGVSGFTHVYDRVLYWTSYASSAASGYGSDIRYGSSAKLKECPKARAGYVRCVVEQ
ncbi:MAG: hypothetical protein IJ151_04505 [Bacteroidales bacterium]|nr:hypothetical protein [Bacteroidales bacterium]